jgi:integrase
MPYKRGKKYIGQTRREGKRKEKVFRTKKAALAWEAEMQQKSDEDWQGKTSIICLGDWAELYLDYVKVCFSEKTYLEKRLAFRKLFESIDPTKRVETLTPAILLPHLQKQLKERSGNAANKDRKNLIAAWNWGMVYMEPALSAPNPCIIKKMPEKRTPRYVPPEEDFWKVYNEAHGQDRIMLLAYLHLAARRGELFRLRWEDVNFHDQTVRLFTRKRENGAWEFDNLPMTEELYTALLTFKSGQAGEWVFINPITNRSFVERKRWLKGLCARAGIEKRFTLHSVRHLSASILAQAGVPVIKIQAILRHKSARTTERYLHQQGDLKKAIQVFSQRAKAVKKPSTFQTA